MVFWGNSLSLRRWNRPESDPHLAAIVNATFKHSLLLSLSLPLRQTLFRGPQKGWFFCNKHSLAWWDRLLLITLLCNRQCFPLIITNPLFHHFPFTHLLFPFPLNFYHHNYEICFLFFVSTFSIAAVLFELLDFILFYFWLFCFTCGSFFFFFSFLFIIAILVVAFNCSILTKEVEDQRSFFKKNRFLKRFLFCLQTIGFFVFFLNY